jgi:hypothetical protein
MSLLLQAFTDHEPASASSTSSVSTANTGQLAAGLLGLFAVPVVAWSEYTLKTTGIFNATAFDFLKKQTELTSHISNKHEQGSAFCLAVKYSVVIITALVSALSDVL